MNLDYSTQYFFYSIDFSPQIYRISQIFVGNPLNNLRNPINLRVNKKTLGRVNLDHNDEIIRRRLKQKYEFLCKDLIEDVVDFW